jgi:hypothetical protein
MTLKIGTRHWNPIQKRRGIQVMGNPANSTTMVDVEEVPSVIIVTRQITIAFAMNCAFSLRFSNSLIFLTLDRGRNVCIHFLLGRCKYGAKCSYAHTKDSLPRGWWGTLKGIKEAKELRSAVNDPIGKADVIVRLENTTAYGQLEKVKRNMLNVEIYNALLPELLRRSDEETTRNGANAGATTNRSTSSSRSVLLLCLSDPELFNDINGHLLKALDRKVNLLRAENATQALAYLSEPNLVGVIIGDEGITNRPNSKVITQLVRYVKQGGAVVIGGLFPTFSDGNSFDHLFKRGFDLPWERGSYFRTTFHKNPQNELVKGNPSLPASYSMKALHLQKIPPESALYKANESSFTQSAVFPPTTITDFDESPAVSVKFGSGMVSYLGDVNAEEASTKTIFAMLGLLDSPLPKPPILSGAEKGEVSQPTADAGKASNGTKRKKKGKKTKNGIDAVPSAPLPKHFSPSQKATAQTTAHHESFIMHICLADSEATAWSYRRSIAAIETRTCVKKATTEAQVWDLFSSFFIAGVFVTDSELTHPKYKLLLDELASYVDDGGSVVFGGAFDALAQFDKLEALFANFHLGWKASSYTRDSLRLSGDWEDKYAFLPKEIDIKAVFLTGVSPDDAVYLPAYNATSSASQTPIAVSQNDLGGLVGYIGDVNAEPCTTPSILAMFDLLKYPRSLERPLTDKFVIVLSYHDTFNDFQTTPLLSEMKAEGIEVVNSERLSNSRLADLLSSPDLQGVFLLDDFVSAPKFSWLIYKIAAYVWLGGCVILADQIGYLPPDEFEGFMTDNFYLPWKISSATELPVTVNLENRMFRNMPHLVEEYDEQYFEGSFLYDVGDDEIVFGSKPGLGPEEATHVSVAYAAVGKGHVAYFGYDDMGEVDIKLMLGIVKR